MVKKIALEEHFSTPKISQLYANPKASQAVGEIYGRFIQTNLWGNIESYRQELMQNEIDHVILSLVSPGIQGIKDADQAIELAKDANDLAYETYVKKYPEQFSAFAAVPMQDPQAAAAELDRAVNQLGAKGALINGYTNLADGSIVYLDDPRNLVFWDKVNELNVPVYLHPRDPEPSQQRIYQDYPGLVGSAWGYTQETAVHAIRLMMSGLFDQYPKLTVILGHLGEGLSQNLPRTQSRLYKQRRGETGGKNQRPLTSYLTTNFKVTTSGHFDTNAFLSALNVFGIDQMMFSIDFPYVTNLEASTWFDQIQMDESMKKQIAYDNAAKLFKIKN